MAAKGQKVDATQEMIAIGASNILGSFTSSFPVTGSFSRTAVNAASGVRTPFNGIYTGSVYFLNFRIIDLLFNVLFKIYRRPCVAGHHRPHALFLLYTQELFGRCHHHGGDLHGGSATGSTRLEIKQYFFWIFRYTL